MMNRTHTKSSNEPLVFPYCEDVAKYEKLVKIGQGTFGEVFKARERRTGQVVALKKILMENEKEGFPITALREIGILKVLSHENIVHLIEICRSKGPPPPGLQKPQNSNPYLSSLSTFFLVFEFCEHDLAGLLSNINVKFSIAEIKMVLYQLLKGLKYIHENNILHRDLKASNVLITKNGILKLADFGLARSISSSKTNAKNGLTNRVVTLWYRPPELLLGDRNYGPAIDIWGAGCIMAEMWTRTPILQGNTEQHQLELITKLCGTISVETWPSVEKLVHYNKIKLHSGPRKVIDRLGPYVKESTALNLLDKMLTLDPSKRISTTSALEHDFFSENPMPCDLSKTLSRHTQSMFEYLTPQRRPGITKPVLQKTQQENSTLYQDRVY